MTLKVLLLFDFEISGYQYKIINTLRMNILLMFIKKHNHMDNFDNKVYLNIYLLHLKLKSILIMAKNVLTQKYIPEHD